MKIGAGDSIDNLPVCTSQGNECFKDLSKSYEILQRGFDWQNRMWLQKWLWDGTHVFNASGEW